MISKGAALISFRPWIVSLLPCRAGNGSILGFRSSAAGVLLPMLWLRLTGNALPPGIGSCLERLTTPAIALIKLAWLDPRSIGLLAPATRIIMRKLVADVSQFGRSGIMPVPQVRRHRDHRLRFDISHRGTNAAAGRIGLWRTGNVQGGVRKHNLGFRVADMLNGGESGRGSLQGGVVGKTWITRKSCIMSAISRLYTEASILRLDEGEASGAG